MKDWFPFVVVFGVLFCIAMFFSFVSGVGKSFQAIKPPESTLKSQKLQTQQRDRAEDTERQRKILMENLQQRVRDNQRR